MNEPSFPGFSIRELFHNPAARRTLTIASQPRVIREAAVSECWINDGATRPLNLDSNIMNRATSLNTGFPNAITVYELS